MDWPFPRVTYTTGHGLATNETEMGASVATWTTPVAALSWEVIATRRLMFAVAEPLHGDHRLFSAANLSASIWNSPFANG
jgi:hypothetical protein